MTISESTTQLFQLLTEATKLDRVALVEVVDRKTNQPSTIICLVTQEDGSYQFFPVAVMIEGYDPMERFRPPHGATTVDFPLSQGGDDAVH